MSSDKPGSTVLSLAAILISWVVIGYHAIFGENPTIRAWVVPVFILFTAGLVAAVIAGFSYGVDESEGP